MIALDTIENHWHQWFSNITGLGCAWADQDAPVLAYPYGLLEILAMRQLSVTTKRHYKQSSDGTWVRTLTRRYRVTMSLQIDTGPTTSINTTPRSLARQLLVSAIEDLQEPETRQAFRDNGIAIRSVGSIQSLGINFQDSIIGRSTVDIVFVCQSTISRTVQGHKPALSLNFRMPRGTNP